MFKSSCMFVLNTLKSFCLFIIFLKGKSHIVTSSLTIHSCLHFSQGIILLTVQPYHYYSTCDITDRHQDLMGKIKMCSAQEVISNYFAVD